MKKQNENMEQPKVAQREGAMSFEIIELEDEMLSNVVGGAPLGVSFLDGNCNC